MIHFMKDGRAICGAAVTSGVRTVARVTCPECRGRAILNHEPVDEPKPTCEGYGPDPLVRKGDKVRLTQAVYHHVRGKDVPAFTQGEVLGIRSGDPSESEAAAGFTSAHIGDGTSGLQALVKFTGFSWPAVVPVELLERVTPVRFLSEREIIDVLKS